MTGRQRNRHIGKITTEPFWLFERKFVVGGVPRDSQAQSSQRARQTFWPRAWISVLVTPKLVPTVHFAVLRAHLLCELGSWCQPWLCGQSWERQKKWKRCAPGSCDTGDGEAYSSLSKCERLANVWRHGPFEERQSLEVQPRDKYVVHNSQTLLSRNAHDQGHTKRTILAKPLDVDVYLI